MEEEEAEGKRESHDTAGEKESRKRFVENTGRKKKGRKERNMTHLPTKINSSLVLTRNKGKEDR